MRKMSRIGAVVLLVVPVLAGCEARRLSELQSQFHQLTMTRAQCGTALQRANEKTAPEAAAAGVERDAWNCLEDPSPAFNDVANGAQKLSENAATPADKVAALRLASLAAWQAEPRVQQQPASPAGAPATGSPAGASRTRAVGFADTAATICADTPPPGRDIVQRPGARDCALMRLLPGLVALEVVGVDAIELDRRLALRPVPAQEPDRGRVRAEYSTAHVAVMDRYDGTAAATFERAAESALATPDLPEAFGVYVARQRLLGACTYAKVANRLPTFIAPSPAIAAADLGRFCPPERASLALEPVMQTAWETARQTLPALTRESFRRQCGLHHFQADLKQRGIEFQQAWCQK